MDIVMLFAVGLLLLLGVGCLYEMKQRRGMPREAGPLFLKWLLVIVGAVSIWILAS